MNHIKPDNKDKKKDRSKNSYKRDLPNRNDITETRHHSICDCPECNTKLIRKKTITFFEEDIPLPAKDEN